jgi:hypothetical protein
VKKNGEITQWKTSYTSMIVAGGSRVPRIVFAIAIGTSGCLWSQSNGSSVRRNASSGDALFKPTITNHTPAPGKAPVGMVWVPGGEFSMGANDPPDMDQVGMKATKYARPVHRVYIDGFFMDKTDVNKCQVCQIRKSNALYRCG